MREQLGELVIVKGPRLREERRRGDHRYGKNLEVHLSNEALSLHLEIPTRQFCKVAVYSLILKKGRSV